MKFNLYHWLVKYRIFYLLSWLLVSFVLLFISYDRTTPVFPQWVGFLAITGAAYPVCRYTAYNLIPRYLYKRRVGIFTIYLFLLAMANAFVTYFLAACIYHLLSGNPVIRSIYYFLAIYAAIMLIDVILISISCIVKIIIDRFSMEQQMLQIEKEKVTTELNFLRAQINPHFLFNVLNTIYFKIDKSNTEARMYVDNFSEMLRYQLYECVTDKIQVSKEINYIRNYIAIQRLRMEKDSDIQLTIDEPIHEFWIAPFLILPIIENAFKHVSNFKDPIKNKVNVSLKVVDDYFYIEATNTYEQNFIGKHVLQSGGLGIQNLKRRLELLYPERHGLTINALADTYNITLKLQYDN